MNLKLSLRFCSKIVACGLLLGSLLPVSVQAQTVSWKQQLGSSSFDTSESVATDSNGNIYISGWTDGSLAGTNNAGSDAWVAKYNPNGSIVWKQQLGLFGPNVISKAVATDNNGNVYISGYTNGSLVGDKQGSSEAWVAKYNSRGNLLWKRQLRSSSSFDIDISESVATDSNGNVYVSGYTNGSLGGFNKGNYDGWVAKYNSSGERMWKRQLGTSMDDYSYDVATDSSGNIYISGHTDGFLTEDFKGEFREFDAWVAKYNASGTLVWKRQLGSSGYDYSYGVATDSKGNVYISGETFGALAGASNAGGDAWVAKYNSSGTLAWKRQLGVYGSAGTSVGKVTDSNGNIYIPGVVSEGVATDSKGNVYISGKTNGSFAGDNQGGFDAWVAKYNVSGALVWKQQLGTNGSDNSYGVATDSIGNVYISGVTNGALGEPQQGGFDAFVVKYTQ